MHIALMHHRMMQHQTAHRHVAKTFLNQVGLCYLSYVVVALVVL